MNKNFKIFIAGHTGMVGSSIVRQLNDCGFNNLICPSHKDLDLINQQAVIEFFKSTSPQYVFIAAGKVGGIHANNTYRGQFLYENLMIQNNLIHAAHETGVEKLLFLGSSCIYPKFSPQPMKEEYLLTGELEQTNEPYAIAKISGIKMCENYYRQYGDNFISVMPTNLYGENDNFDLQTSHVLPALIRKFHESKVNNSEFVEVWGSGKPKREFLYVDDVANACVFLLDKMDAHSLYDKMKISHINIGSGIDVTIAKLAEIIRRIIGFGGEIKYDSSMPDGTPQKLLDISRIKSLGWEPSISLEDGIKLAYDWFKQNVA